MHDIIIIGGGPAGLSAALYALRAGKSVLILEKNSFGGQIATSPRVENYPGVMSVSGTELADNLMAQVMEKGCEIELEEVTGVRDAGDMKTIRTTDGDFEAKAVIIATGARHRQLGLPREEKLTGRGVSYCAVCDGAFFKGKPVAVVGGGNAALQDALLLSASSSTVYIIHRRGEFRAEAVNVKKILERSNIKLFLGSEVVELVGENELKAIVVEGVPDGHRNTLRVDALFVAVGFEAENGVFSDVAALDANGWLDSGEDCRTRTPGVFAAGDCTGRPYQVARAVGQGNTAALSASEYLDKK
jgi:thioredoxin reductase (NADPH)